MKTFTQLEEGKLDSTIDNIFDNASMVARHMARQQPLLRKKKQLYHLIDK